MRALTLTIVPVKSILSMSYSFDTAFRCGTSWLAEGVLSEWQFDMAHRKNQRDWLGARLEGIKRGRES